MADPMPETCVPTEAPVVSEAPARKPKAPRKPKSQAPPAAPVVTLAEALAAIPALDQKLNALIQLALDQAALIETLIARPVPTAAPAAPPAAPTGPQGLKVVGQRQASYHCPCPGPDGKPHGTVTINRFGNCPACYTAAHFNAQRQAA